MICEIAIAASAPGREECLENMKRFDRMPDNVFLKHDCEQYIRSQLNLTFMHRTEPYSCLIFKKINE